MGIVVAVFMLLGVLLIWPRPRLQLGGLRRKPGMVGALGISLLLAGLWNALWYGLRHLGDFWGLVALLSGVLMIAASLIVLAQRDPVNRAAPATLGRIYKVLKPLSPVLACALAAFFALYAVTLVRLNLGYTIIGS